MSAPMSMQAPHTNDHVPVMLGEMLDALAPEDGEQFIDGTFGGGGYSRAILDRADCAVWAIDRDADAIARGHILEASYDGRLMVLAGRFGNLGTLLAHHDIKAVDGVVLDLGLSSYQLADAARGFSFQANGPLDMRMGIDGESASDVVNSLPEEMLADIIHLYGEERFARTIARAIVRAREVAPITTTTALADVVRRAVRSRTNKTRTKSRHEPIDPATRTFQALRIHVNDELGDIERGLAAAEKILRPGGRLVIVAFHSLEDRSVKSFLSIRCGSRARPSRHQPSLPSLGALREAAPTFQLLHRGALKPQSAEIEANSRARSARLRAALRTNAPLEAAA